MSKGLFDLTGFESMKDDDLMSMSINESATEHEELGISVPSNSEIPVGAYSKALEQLKKSFKEGYEILSVLENADVIAESAYDRQNAFTCNAIIESCENGPIYERVDRTDKDDVKAIVKKIRKSIVKAAANEDVDCYTPDIWMDTLFNSRGLITIISLRLWQILGIVYLEPNNIDKFCDIMTEKFKDELGEYKIIPAITLPNNADSFRTHFGWKDRRSVYYLIVDRKFPSEMKDMQKKLETELKKTEDKK